MGQWCPLRENAAFSLSTTPAGTRRPAWTGAGFERRFLPGYSPDFNPIERLWLRLKADFFCDFIARSPDELHDRLCNAINHFIADRPTVASQCAFRK
jgi:transposase